MAPTSADAGLGLTDEDLPDLLGFLLVEFKESLLTLGFGEERFARSLLSVEVAPRRSWSIRVSASVKD
ncbi:hypothetical protein [Nonomuraea sp. NPDC050786]|uniref:hypothetical protein n=1 Tax=Nonomuraea sp. NPDC050786 TaxID=3154840 RepID=UPI00340A1C35